MKPVVRSRQPEVSNVFCSMVIGLLIPAIGFKNKIFSELFW